MCGICGLVSLAGLKDSASSEQKVNSMIDTLMHRGPDDTGIYNDHSAVFGMTRLAIRGLSDGKQPIIDAETGVIMACNGEIDNHLELREWLLNRGRTVDQSTDVAVIPGLYLELGADFVNQLKGAFELINKDAREKLVRVVVGADRAVATLIALSSWAGIFLFMRCFLGRAGGAQQ